MRMATDPESCDEETDINENDVFDERDPAFIDERFRVDRRKLEQMLQAAEEGIGETGEEFFRKIMGETATTITWPSKLKIGAKSKKDPHIKITGLPESVKLAKDRVMAVLDTKSNRVTLKMDVSHTDHSHIIGKGGYNIKKVMQDTGCHIHFPDSNRGSSTDKSNQVSIAGQPLGVEAARQQIRDMLPLVLSFELPLGSRGPIDNNSGIIQHISQTCNVNITFKHRPRSGNQTVILRGSQQSIPGIKDAVSRLVEYFTGNIVSTVPVNMQIDIAPQHHLFIIGRNGSNIKHITTQTGAHLSFPDPNSSHRKGAVFLSGTVDSVICARTLLLECLPLVLMFDLREEDGDVDSAKLTRIMDDYNVFVSVKPKPKQPSKSVIIKSAERNAKNIYLARMEILGVDKNQNRASSPIYSSIISPSSDRSFYSGTTEYSSSPPSPTYSYPYNGLVSAIGQVSSSSSSSWFSSSDSSKGISTMVGGGVTSPPFSFKPTTPPPPPPPGLGPPNSMGSPVVSTASANIRDFSVSPTGSYTSIESSNGSSSAPSGKPPSPIGHRTSSPPGFRSPSPIGPPGFNSRSPVMDQRDSPILGGSGSVSPRSPTAGSPSLQEEGLLINFQSDSEGRMFSRTSSGSSGSGIASDQQTVEILSGTKNISFHTSDDDKNSFSSSLRSSLFNKLQLNNHSLPIDEYERKKELASIAMQKKVQFTEVRVPTDTWSGLGFSKSMPESAIKQLLEFKSRNKGNMLPYNGPVNGTLPENPLPLSSLETTSRETRSNSTSMYETSTQRGQHSDNFSPTVGERRNTYPFPSPPLSDLEKLLEKLGLMKYYNIFQEQEVDWQTFLTLTDDDLKELGVTTFGARRKLLLAIAELKKSPMDVFTELSTPVNPLPFHRKLPMDVASHSGRW
ncbi:protein bicaudal C homolog 1-like isoform X2 [Actinia tenebrosa]|uniref:Protein bicaudal C homolog 1-like isoform X2 n=1 Tax=Actinia tenebrosa TaxID=6105 RepID=A0A6P8HW86_ACTTE|nr:protein bicaudal C homolog 1-like isoform X2 [Actinia tenebrosa]